MIKQIETVRPGDSATRYKGFTTRQALGAIADAIKNPGLEIQVNDHHGTREASERQLWMIVSFVQRLELHGFKFNPKNLRIRFTRDEP